MSIARCSFFADSAIFCSVLAGAFKNEVKILVQELGGQRGEGANFQKGLIIVRTCLLKKALAVCCITIFLLKIA